MCLNTPRPPFGLWLNEKPADCLGDFIRAERQVCMLFGVPRRLSSVGYSREVMERYSPRSKDTDDHTDSDPAESMVASGGRCLLDSHRSVGAPGWHGTQARKRPARFFAVSVRFGPQATVILCRAVGRRSPYERTLRCDETSKVRRDECCGLRPIRSRP